MLSVICQMQMFRKWRLKMEFALAFSNLSEQHYILSEKENYHIA